MSLPTGAANCSICNAREDGEKKGTNSFTLFSERIIQAEMVNQLCLHKCIHIEIYLSA